MNTTNLITSFFICLLFLCLCTRVDAQGQKEVNWAVSTNVVFSGVNYYAPFNEFLEYFHIAPLSGYSLVLDMSVPFENNENFSWYANIAYLKTGFKGQSHIEVLEDEEDSFNTYRHDKCTTGWAI